MVINSLILIYNITRNELGGVECGVIRFVNNPNIPR